MAETQGDIYVRKEVFDARISRLEELHEKTLAEIRDVKSEMRQLEAKFDSVKGMYMWGITGFWIILGLAAAFAVIIRIVQPVTLEDVKNIVNATVIKHLSGGK